jgi:hypothetical protein
MSGEIEEQNLESAVVRKATPRGRSVRAKSGNSDGTPKPKKTSKPTVKPRSVGKRRVVRTKPAGKKNVPGDDRIMTVGEIIPGVEVTLPKQDLLAEIGASAGAEATADLSVPISQDRSCVTKTLVSDGICGEKENVVSEREPEVITDLVNVRQSAGQKTTLDWLAGAWNWVRRQLLSRQPRKRLRVCESVSLGEKRFVAVIEVDGEQFLVGGASSSVATLARLEPTQEFSAVLKRRWAQDPVQA